MNVGKRIRELRKAEGITQKELGKRAGIAEPTIRRYENGQLSPKYETVEKLAEALHKSMEDVMTDSVVSAGTGERTIGNRIRMARIAAALTQEELASLVGVRRPAISKYESGIVDPSASQIQKIASALRVSASYFLGDVEPAQHRKVCPMFISGNIPQARCIGVDCAFWCAFSGDCAIATIAGILADSTICQNIFEDHQEEADHGEV